MASGAELVSIVGYDRDLANRVRRWVEPIGVRVVEIGGWQDRGRTYATFNPYGSVNHHTAGGAGGVAPSLGICINGRSDLPGPLCHVHQQRDDVVNIVAAGVANHAGPGGWGGYTGNQTVFGLEVEHVGTDAEPFPMRRWEISCRVHAAFHSGLEHPDVARLLSQHFEWGAIQGKPDFYRPLLPGGPDGFRRHVAALLAAGPGGIPTPPQEEDDYVHGPDVAIDKAGAAWWARRDPDAHVWLNKGGRSNEWWPLPAAVPGRPAGELLVATSAPRIAAAPDGSMVVTVRGPDNATWTTSRPARVRVGQPDEASTLGDPPGWWWSAWWSAGGPS